MSDHRPFALPGTRPQYGPDRPVDVLHIDLNLRPDIDARTLDGVCTTTVRAIADEVVRLRLDADDLIVRAVRDADGADLPYRSGAHALEIDLPSPLRRGETMRFAVEYRVERPRRGLYFPGSARQVWTQSQDQDARAWFPCFDHPSIRATTAHTIVVPRGMFALGNGALVERIDDGEHTTWRYEQRQPHATYLVTLVAGDFVTVEQAHARVPVAYHVPPGREADGERAFRNTPRMIDAFERVTGVPYPWDRYGQVAVADFIFGGMENTAATTQTDRALYDERAALDHTSDPLVAHELAHQWFGDLVTCRDWSHAWLNEGFATYFECVWAEADRGWDEYAYNVRQIFERYLEEDADRYRRPIVCSTYRDPVELFDRHLYEKGGAVLHMLRGELGWDGLRRAIGRYLDDHRGRNVETIDFIRAVEAETGRNPRQFFDQFVLRAGHPELVVTYRWDPERRCAILGVEQEQTIDDERPPYVFDLEVGFVPALPAQIGRDAGPEPIAGERRLRLRVEHGRDGFAVPLDAEPALVRVDPSGWILGTLQLRLGTDVAIRALRTDPSVVMRIRAIAALAREGSRTALDAIVAALHGDPFWGVSAAAAKALGNSLAPGARAALIEAARHAHPKVRRAVATALGTTGDAAAATALVALADDASYLVCGAALRALGKTRDPRAFDVLVAGLGRSSWNDHIADGAARGLAELGEARALEPLLAAAAPEQHADLRRGAVLALAQLGNAVESVRARAVDAVEHAFVDPAFQVRMAAATAAETLGDPRLLPVLDRVAATDPDGRMRRDAAEAAMRVREAQRVPAEVERMRTELDRVRADLAALRERVDTATP